MFSESFKYFFAVTVLDESNQILALLAHIYGKVAICKSCDKYTSRISRFRLSRGKVIFLLISVRGVCRGSISRYAYSPTEIWTSVISFGLSFLFPRSPIKYPQVLEVKVTSRTRHLTLPNDILRLSTQLNHIERVSECLITCIERSEA